MTWHNTANVLFMTFPHFATDAEVITALVATYKTITGYSEGLTLAIQTQIEALVLRLVREATPLSLRSMQALESLASDPAVGLYIRRTLASAVSPFEVHEFPRPTPVVRAAPFPVAPRFKARKIP